MGQKNTGCAAIPADAARLERLLEEAASLLSIEAAEIWSADDEAAPCRLGCRYRSLPNGAAPPRPYPALGDLAARITREEHASNKAFSAKVGDIYFATGLPFEMHDRRLALLILSFVDQPPGSETVLRAKELLARFSRRRQ